MSDTLQRFQAAWIKGSSAACPAPAPSPAKPWRLLLIGAPGIGKGTQAALFSQFFGACQLSTGDVFRAAKRLPEEEKTPAIREAVTFMRAGKLVPDETVVSIVRERVGCLRCPTGFLLDGFPRTVPQAEELDRLLQEERISLDAVISYELAEEKVLQRVSGRRVCAQCKLSYHLVDLPPKVADHCDRCGGPLYQRDDDRPEAVHVRMETYRESSAPLVEYYRQRQLLLLIDCGDTPEHTFQRTLDALSIRH